MPDPTLEEVREALDWVKGEHFDECGMHEPGKCPVEVLARAVRAQAEQPIMAYDCTQCENYHRPRTDGVVPMLCTAFPRPDMRCGGPLVPVSINLYAGLEEGSQEPREENGED